MTTESVADRFFTAMNKRDLDELEILYADDAKIWHNFDNLVQGKSQIINNVRTLPEGVVLSFDIRHRVISGDDFAQRFDTVMSMNGAEIGRIFTAMFITVRDGKITEIQEYMDSAQFPKQG